ncbi:MAG: 3-deoxy-D-manno-octulosonic acid transferase [Bacteroidetes bacterium]|nr:MAG: 3-deoxy-D-manno-octulosonic acid transferase [Bacteroidota bacterium]
MRFLYEIGIQGYRCAILLASLFNPKAKKWVKGRQQLFRHLKTAFQGNKEEIAWFHCASLGEFEQGRPIIERFKESYPSHKVLLTFFSPSGYEIRKDYAGADYIFYLPADTYRNARRFYAIVKPRVLFLVKYEYWYNYLHILSRADVPIYVISAVFRKSQPFFRGYGAWFRKQLKGIRCFFLQDKQSAALLNQIGLSRYVITGDTRVDRVLDIAAKSVVSEKISAFCAQQRVWVCGSTWPIDEAMIVKAIPLLPKDVKIIIAPHEVDPTHITTILNTFGEEAVRYADYDPQKNHHRILVIDCIGYLSATYRCANLAYIGGGFGAGIHNILEAAVYGIPVLFGPNNAKFPEAEGLQKTGGGYEVKNQETLNVLLERLLNHQTHYKEACQGSSSFIQKNRGATANVFKNLNL